MGKITTEEGVCPRCQSDNIDYLDSETVDGLERSDCECRNCEATFSEYRNWFIVSELDDDLPPYDEMEIG